jgi:uncharacterized protein (UPF0264 family)
MRLLVSVRSAAEAAAALAGGADVIDAKDPASGALGAVSPHVLREICECVSGTRLVTAALGDADAIAVGNLPDSDERALETMTRVFVEAGAALVKVGFPSTSGPAAARRLLRAAVHAVRAAAGTTGVWHDSGVVAVAYADDCRGRRDRRDYFLELSDVAADAGAVGVLLDTANKSGPGLRGLVSETALTAWVAAAHDRGLLAAVAGKLTADDLPFVRDAGADIAGVRSAACTGGRRGAVNAERVRLLGRAYLSEQAPAGDRPVTL